VLEYTVGQKTVEGELLRFGPRLPDFDWRTLQYCRPTVYQRNTCTVEMIYDTTILTPLTVGFGITLAVVGGALFFLTQFIERRRTLSTGISS